MRLSREECLTRARRDSADGESIYDEAAKSDRNVSGEEIFVSIEQTINLRKNGKNRSNVKRMWYTGSTGETEADPREGESRGRQNTVQVGMMP